MPRALRIVVALLILTAAVYVGVWIAPGVALHATGSAFAVAIVLALLGSVLPPALAAIRLPYTFALGFVLVLVVNGAMLLLAADLLPDAVTVDGFWAALLASVLIAAASTLICMLVGADDQAVALAVLRRVARRQGLVDTSRAPGIVFLEIDGLAAPVLRRAMASGHAPNMQRWMDERGYVLAEWEPDLSSQTGASQAGILLGSNDDIPAFRWVEKDTGKIVSCSSPEDCAAIERRLATGEGLLVDGGASRGNLLSGEAQEVILTVSRIEAEKGANPGYRAFMASGGNAARVLVLFAWEILLELIAAARQRRRDVVPRGHRGGAYPLLRATMTTLVRDLVIFGVLTDMMRGRPAVYATFASYDEVAHHSGLERPDTLEALRKLDERFGRVAAMRAWTPRPYVIVVLSDHGQTQGATFKQRHGYGVDELVQRSLSGGGTVDGVAGGDEQDAMALHAIREAGAPAAAPDEPEDVPAAREGDGAGASAPEAIVLGSGNLALIYLMDIEGRATLEGIERRHPRLLETLRTHEHIGWLLVRSERDGPVVLGPRGRVRLTDGEVEGEDPLVPFGPSAARHLLRTDTFPHCGDVMVGSFYDPVAGEGCAFEELISFHGGLGGEQTQPFILYPASTFASPVHDIVGAEAVHDLLAGWRAQLQAEQPAVVVASARPPVAH
jgi:uncharacterized membrane protein YvlD (DUF360 family)